MKNQFSIKVYAIFFLLSLAFTPVYSKNNAAGNDKPAWTNYKTRKAKYPKNVYISGFSSAEYRGDGTRKEFMDRLQGYARSRLAESVQVEIKSMTTSQMVTQDKVTANYFKQTSLSLAKIQVSGLKTETYFDEAEEEGYVFSYAKKANVTDNYINRLQLDVEQTGKLLEQANTEKEAGSEKKALQHYFKARVKLNEIQEAQGLLMAMNQWNHKQKALKMDTVKTLLDAVEKGITSIQRSREFSLDGLSYFLAHGLALQIEQSDKPVYPASLTYEDRGVSSPFGKRLITELESDLNQEGIRVAGSAARFRDRQSSHLMLKGTYWEEKDALKIILSLKDPEKNQTVATAEGKLPLKWLEENKVKYLPGNYNSIQNDIQALNNKEITSSGLHAELYTNKGSDNPVFTKGDTLKLYVKTNKPCYVRFIYHLADGKKVLMLDNHYIDRSKVNKVYQIPDIFEISAPYGGEILQLNAQTKPFDPLQTEPYGHYKRITNDMNAIISNVRGFKPINDEQGQAEARVTLTTLAE